MARIKAQGDDQGLQRRMAEERRLLRSRLESTLANIAEDAVLIFQAHALFRTGRLSRGIRAIASGLTAIVRADARNPQTGYDYVGVTRFGHRLRKIVPKHRPKKGRYLAPIPGVGPRFVNKRAALRIGAGRGFIFRASSRGFHPHGDWAERALPEVQREAESQLRDFGRGWSERLA